jgi:hypothetical protein
VSRIAAPFSLPTAPNMGKPQNVRVESPSAPFLEPTLKKDSVHFGMTMAHDERVQHYHRQALILILDKKMDFAGNVVQLLRFSDPNEYADVYWLSQVGQKWKDKPWATGIADMAEYLETHVEAIDLVMHLLGNRNFIALIECEFPALPDFVQAAEKLLTSGLDKETSLDALLDEGKLQDMAEKEFEGSKARRFPPRDLLPEEISPEDLSLLLRILSITANIMTDPDDAHQARGLLTLRSTAQSRSLDLRFLEPWDAPIQNDG